MYPDPKYQSSGSMVFFVCIDSGCCFTETGLLRVETVVLRILSWGNVGSLGCFIDSRLQICNSSNRSVWVCFLGFNVFVHFSEMGLVLWIETVVLGILSCGKVGWVFCRFQVADSQFVGQMG